MTRPERGTGPARTTMASLVVIVLAVAAGAFFVGTMTRPDAGARVAVAAAASASPAARPTASATPTPTAAPTAGTVAWDALRGGECLDDYESAWQTTYEVVPCESKHEAQATRRIALKDDAWPGEDDLVERLGLTCAAGSTLRLDDAERVEDLRIAFSYPTESRWAEGDRAAYCFVDRTGDDTLKGSLAAT